MPDKPQIRLLICFECKSIEPLPDFLGIPEHDEVLAAAIRPHRSAGIQHNGTLGKVDEDQWEVREVRTQILARINEQLSGGETGLGSDAYTMAETFKDDAMTCFGVHLRNPACSDYKSDAKRLVPNTAAERKELGLAPAAQYDREGNQITKYLCEYCPVHSMVQQALRKKAGLYDK